MELCLGSAIGVRRLPRETAQGRCCGGDGISHPALVTCPSALGPTVAEEDASGFASGLWLGIHVRQRTMWLHSRRCPKGSDDDDRIHDPKAAYAPGVSVICGQCDGMVDRATRICEKSALVQNRREKPHGNMAPG